MSNLLRRVVIILFSLVFLFARNSITYASTLFSDDFTSPAIDSSKWNVFINGGQIFQGSGTLHLSADFGHTYPFVSLSQNVFPNNFYTISTKFQFNGFLNYGYGLVFSDSIIANGVVSDLAAKDIIFQIWPDNSNSFSIYASVCPSLNPTCQTGYYKIISKPSEIWYSLEISHDNNIYTLTLDDGSSKSEIFRSVETSRNIQYFWIGNPQFTGGVTWGNLEVDNVLIADNTLSSSISPTILIPGFGASWDVGAVLAGTEGSDWKIPDFVKNYDNLIASFENAGYKRGGNLFIFGYDWRKGVGSLGTDLNVFIERLISEGKILGTDKINLVGHSMGGLIARSYAQNFGLDHVGKIVTSGSPHLGTAITYGIWEGGVFWETPWWQKAGLELLTQINQRPGESKVESIRRIAPSIRDLLPVTNYLKKGGSDLVWNSMSQVNSFLPEANRSLDSINNLTETISGEGVSTVDFINVNDRNWIDRLEKRWEDGKPTATNPFEFTTLGDGTILKSSAVGGFSKMGSVEADHAGLIGEAAGIGAIFDRLELDKTKILTGVPADTREGVFMASLRSPGTLRVCDSVNVCDGMLGINLPEAKLFMLPGYANQMLDIQVLGNGESGEYKLHLGVVDDDGVSNWEVMTGTITPIETDEYFAKVSNSKLVVEVGNETAIDQVKWLTKKLKALVPKFKNDDYENYISKSFKMSILRRFALSNILVRYSSNAQITGVTLDLWRALDRLDSTRVYPPEKNTRDLVKIARQVTKSSERVAKIQGERAGNLLAARLYLYGEELLDSSQSAASAELTLSRLMSAKQLFLTVQRIR